MYSLFSRVRKVIKKKPEYLVYIYFFLITSVLALSMKILQVGPDETIHIGIIEHYAKYSLDPFLVKQTTDFNLGELTRNPSYFYNYILSIFVRLFRLLHIYTPYLLRMINVILGSLTLVGLNWLGRELKLPNKIRFLILFFVANIPMYLFLSAVVNYDNLVILLSTIGITTAVSISNNFDIKKMYILTLIIIIGPIVKLSFVALSTVFTIFILYTAVLNRRKMLKSFSSYSHKPLIVILALSIALISIGLFSERYGPNLLKYQALKPSCEKVLTDSQCSENFIYTRTKIYKDAKLAVPTINPVGYIVEWSKIMVSRTYGLLGERSFKNWPIVIMIGNVIFANFLALLIIMYRPFKHTKYWFIPASAFVYLAGLILTNINIYRYSQEIGLAVQGRYWFPILFPLLMYSGYLFQKTFKVAFQNNTNILLYIAIGLLIVMGPINILHGIGPHWLR